MKIYQIMVSEPWDYKSAEGGNVVSGEVLDWVNDRCIIFRSDELIRFPGELSGDILILSKRFEKQLHANGLTVNGGLLRVKYDRNSLTNNEQELKDQSTFVLVGTLLPA